MPLLSASIGIIIGSIVFVIADLRILAPAVITLFVSTTAFTTFVRHKREILLALTFFLLMFFNYNLRSEQLEYFDINQYLNSKAKPYYLQIVSGVREAAFFQSEFILEAKELKPNFLTKIRELVLPYRVLARADSIKGFERGDIVILSTASRDKSQLGRDKSRPVPTYEVEKLSYYKAKIYKKDKVFNQLTNKINKNLVFVDHKSSWLNNLQESIKNYYLNNLSFENAQITNSLLLGSRASALPDGFNKQVRNLGLGHFFAASGFNLLILMLSLTWLFKIFHLPHRLSSVVTLIVVFIYSGLADFSPSIVRAAIFISAYLILDIFDRKLLSIRFLVILAGIVLFIDPYTIFDLGFQLSYLSTLALLIWASKIKNALSENKFTGIVPAYFLDIVAVSLAAQVFLLPFIIFYFNSLQVWTIIANLVFTPLLSLLVVLSYFGVTFIIEPLLDLLRYLTGLSVHLPFIDDKTEISITTALILLMMLNLIAYALTIKPKANVSKTGKLINDRYVQSSLILGMFFVLLAINLQAFGVTSIKVKDGFIAIDGKRELVSRGVITDNKSNTNYKYLDYKNIKILVIYKRNSLAKLGTLLNDLQQVHILVLPNLRSNDMYFDTLVKITSPQFIITSYKKQSKRVKENLEILGKSAHTIVNFGNLYISDRGYWSISE